MFQEGVITAEQLATQVVGLDASGSGPAAEDAGVAPQQAAALEPEPAVRLTPTEERVIELTDEGKSVKEIAEIMSVKPGSVSVYLSTARKKLKG
jgi:DNA-binding CsgD family transcriptional regulator